MYNKVIRTLNLSRLVSVQEEYFRKNLCYVIDMGEMAGIDLLKRIEKRDKITKHLRHTFKAQKRDQWLKILGKADVPWGPVYSLKRSFSDQQAKYYESMLEIDLPKEGKIKLLSFPRVFFRSTLKKVQPSPEWGMNTRKD